MAVGRSIAVLAPTSNVGAVSGPGSPWGLISERMSGQGHSPSGCLVTQRQTHRGGTRSQAFPASVTWGFHVVAPIGRSILIWFCQERGVLSHLRQFLPKLTHPEVVLLASQQFSSCQWHQCREHSTLSGPGLHFPLCCIAVLLWSLSVCPLTLSKDPALPSPALTGRCHQVVRAFRRPQKELSPVSPSLSD